MPKHLRHVPFQFANGVIVTSVAELIGQLENYPYVGEHHLLRGDIRTWLLECDEKRLAYAAAISVSQPVDNAPNKHLRTFFALIEPAENSAIRLASGIRVSSLKELIKQLENYPYICEHHLRCGDLEEWFIKLNEPHLAKIAAESALVKGAGHYEKFVDLIRAINFFADASVRRFTFILIGRTGVGKSSTINSLLGREIAPIGDFEPVTAEVIAYDARIGGIPCRVVDTPGLCDHSQRDADYIEQIKAGVGEHGADSLWFVTTLADNRVRTDEISAERQITEAFGSEIWLRAILVFTHADMYSDESEYLIKRTGRAASFRKVLDDVLAEYEPRIYAESVPSVFVSNRSSSLPDGSLWLSELYLATSRKMSDEGLASFVLATADRVVLTLDGREEVNLRHLDVKSPIDIRDERLSLADGQKVIDLAKPSELPIMPAPDFQVRHTADSYAITSLGTEDSKAPDRSIPYEATDISPIGREPVSHGSRDETPTVARPKTDIARPSPHIRRSDMKTAPTRQEFAPSAPRSAKREPTKVPTQVTPPANLSQPNPSSSVEQMAAIPSPSTHTSREYPSSEGDLDWLSMAKNKVRVVNVDQSIHIDQSLQVDQSIRVQSVSISQPIYVDRREFKEAVQERIDKASGVQGGLEKVVRGIGSFVDGVIEVAEAVAHGVSVVGRAVKRIFSFLS